ncbi:MFS transporter [Clavibacter michiganensis]|uniref:MFS transporter n=1 Tax=Clavibacter michiganensis TaxID=28447 RepID=UPI0013651DDD|nr:MFS transporter [Clavibacter michiganensis]MBE3078878.1 MFS transporter [Clavibacter michiganensis subsp. michiganensis]MDO4044016.1 MFS transporter [Clavibacter michiganensis]MDO4052386.1 MFS transporter [Clavibacter michiganensis]MDO4056195.1 MFS transporter [Clavibacter michiganensis]MDO4068603.1 MFS transporter [Clavibacter michiganensis]
MPSPSAPTLSRTPAPTRDVRRARVAVGVLFFTNGAIFANLLPRYPSIKAELGLANVEFGAAVAASPLGALIAGLAAGVLIRRYRSARVAVAATVVASAGILLAGLAPGWLVLAGALFLAGAMDSITDVAQNSHALRVQRLYGRSIINSFHAVWSIGAVAGGIMGAAAAQIRMPLLVHLSISAALFSALAVLSLLWLLKGPEPEPGEGGAAHAHAPDPEADVARAASPRALGLVTKYGVLLALVIIASGGAIVEDAGSSWSAIYLSGDLGASAFVAGLGFISLQGMQFIGRMLGDRMVDRFGQRAIARLGGVLVLVGMGAALAFPSIVGTIVGFGVAGFGVATLIPAAMQAADELPGFKPGTGLTIVGWLLRLGFLISPPVVGAIADASSLRFGLIFIPAAGLLVLVFSRVLATRRAHPAAQELPGASVASS